MKHRSWVSLALAAVGALMLGVGVVGVSAAPSGWLNVDGLLQFNSGGGGSVDWANAGPAGAACANGGVNVTGSGGIFNCGRAGAPPIAPTLTAAAAADPTIISTAFIVDPIAGDTGACNDDPTTLTGGGPKNGDAFTSYTWGAGTSPAKTELSNVYAVSHTKANGHPEVYFAAERLVNNGDSHMDFEFLQSVIGLTGSCSAAGGFTGNRTEGDLLFAVDFTNGGTLAGFTIYQWHCAAEPGPQPVDGTVCNPGGTAHYEAFVATPFASLVVNSAQISCGGWVCRDQVTNDPTTIATNDLLEGGVDLQGIPFTGCFNTFLPHTRTAQSFTSVLTDFAGPVGFRSCRNPATSSNSTPGGSGVTPGATVHDNVTLGNGGAGFTPTGTVRFFLCRPAQVTASGCPTGTQVGAVKTLVGGGATSDNTSATSTPGKYCWRTVYTPDANSTGVYAPATHTNATSECFNIAAPVSLPNTGGDAQPVEPQVPWQLFVFGPGLVLAFAWRRSRAVAAVLVAGVIAGAAPAAPSAAPAVHGAGVAQASPQVERAMTSPAPLDTVKAKAAGWRLVIPRIGVDAVIQSVGRDTQGAMARPGGLDVVGWYRHGPLPGQSGDAVIDGHFGLPAEPAVFRHLHLLRPGDGLSVVWPDGRTVKFRVTASDVVDATAHPSGLFARSGPARLSLITCAGDWDQALATYSDRLIVTAVPT
jgi:sortase (surface protein transpeptidase)